MRVTPPSAACPVMADRLAQDADYSGG